LHLCRDLIALRREIPELRSGDYASLPSPDGVWAWQRSEGIVVAVNLSDDPSSITTGAGTIAIGTRRERDGEPVEGELSLGPWEGAMLRVAPS
jgi:glycosidase